MKTLTVDIRKAERADAAAVACVHEASWRGAYGGIIPYRSLNRMIARRGEAWWGRAIERAASVLVLDMGGEVAGYATLGRNRARALPQKGEIYELYLKPEFQGIGLGGRLFGAARERLERHGLSGLVVWALEENTPAVAFYERAGGRDVAEGVETFDDRPLRKIAFVWN